MGTDRCQIIAGKERAYDLQTEDELTTRDSILYDLSFPGVPAVPGYSRTPRMVAAVDEYLVLPHRCDIVFDVLHRVHEFPIK